MPQHICKQCFNQGGGCCFESEEGIFVTLRDAENISKITGMNINDFVEYKQVPWAHVRAQEPDKNFHELFNENKILSLKFKNGKCMFLTDEGCSVFEYRPMLCRFFPFWFHRENGGLKIELALEDSPEEEECSLCEKYFYSSIKDSLLEFNETEEKLLKLAESYEKDMKEYKEYSHLLETHSPSETLKLINREE